MRTELILLLGMRASAGDTSQTKSQWIRINNHEFADRVTQKILQLTATNLCVPFFDQKFVCLQQFGLCYWYFFTFKLPHFSTSSRAALNQHDVIPFVMLMSEIFIHYYLLVSVFFVCFFFFCAFFTNIFFVEGIKDFFHKKKLFSSHCYCAYCSGFDRISA